MRASGARAGDDRRARRRGRRRARCRRRSGRSTRRAAAARKLGPRDLAACVVQRALGATTVGGTLAICGAAGIQVMATGGLGGVHRGLPDASRRLGRPRRARAHAGDRRLLGRQEPARRAGDLRAARDARASRCSASARTSCRSSTRARAARPCRRGSRARRRRPRSRSRTGGSAARPRWCSRGRPTRASTTPSR